MDEEKKPVSLHNRPGYEQRLKNTAELLSNFAKENLDKELADEIIQDLAPILKDDDD